MAEGDTIMRLARRLDAALAGEAVSVRTPGRRRPEGRSAGELDGRTLTGAESRGKHLLIRFEGGLVLHSHLGMKGGWHLYAPGERWRYPASRAWIELAGPRATAVNFNGTSMRIVREAELARDRRLARLGPDVLGPGLTEPEMVAALRRGGAGTELGESLLDQTLLAGIGNIFKSEGAFAAEIDPWRRLGDLSDAELGRVASATRALMVAAAESGRQPKSVHGRAGRPCERCGAPIRSRGQGDDARITYWCQSCQH
jgi:endonuclease-8